MTQPLSRKTAIVTGSAQGVGRAAALALARAGADVAINDLRHGAELSSLADEISALGRRVLIVAGDVSEQSVVESAVQQVQDTWGGLDLAVNSAVYSDRQLFHEADMYGFRRTIDVTMWGAFYLLRAAAQNMLQHGRGGAMVFISSPHAFIAVPRSMSYNMAKGALDQMVRTAAVELAAQRVRVNMIHPGWVDTPGERKFFTDEQIQKSAERLPMGRLARPDEIARGVVFLCDPASEYITGSSILIDGATTLPFWARRGSGIPD